MQLPRKYVVAGLLALIVTPSAHAVTVVKTRIVDVNSDTNTGPRTPFFTLNTDGTTAILPSSNGWAPATATTAGAVTETSPRGTLAVVGNATSVGVDGSPGTDDDWQNGNGIPVGLTLNLTAEFKISIGPNAPAGSMLTLSTTNVGNGLGVTQTSGTVSQMEPGEEILVSPFTITNVGFSGMMTESGFTVGTPSVTSFGTRSFRSAAFVNASEGAILTRTSDGETIGFGTQSGSIASGVFIDNNFDDEDGGVFPEVQAGPYTLALTATSAMGLKGIGFSYDFTYDINPDVVADNADFDGDLDVDGADFLTWQQNFGTETGGLRSQGNANPTVDGAIDSADFAIWQDQFGTAPSVAATLGVPEPSALLLAVGSSIALGVRRRSRRTSRR